MSIRSSPASPEPGGKSALHFLEIPDSELPYLSRESLQRSVDTYRHMISQIGGTPGVLSARSRVYEVAVRNLDKAVRELNRRGCLDG